MSATMLPLPSSGDSKSSSEAKNFSESREVKSTIEFLHNTDNRVLLKIEPGKPNRHKKTEKDPDRITASAQKGPTCFYYATILGARSEKTYLQDRLCQKRKYASEYRKERSKLDFYDMLAQTCSMIEKNMEFVSSDTVIFRKRMILLQFSEMIRAEEKAGKVSLISSNGSEVDLKEIKEAIEKIELDSEIDLYQAIKNAHEEKLAGINMTFLRLLGYDLFEVCQKQIQDVINSVYEKIGKSHLVYPRVERFEDINPIIKYSSLLLAAETQLKKIYGLELIHWKPTDGIDVLFNLMKNNASPIYIGGYYSRDSYTNPAILLNDSGYYEIFHYKKGTHLINPSCKKISHAISVIGVEKNTKKTLEPGWVYYIDPNIESDPNKKRRLYVMPYSLFCKCCLDVGSRSDLSHSAAHKLDFAFQKPRKP